MRVKADHEEEGQVVGVPECFEALDTNLLVGSGVPGARLSVYESRCDGRDAHQEHYQEQGVPGDSSWLSVVNLECRLGTDLGPLDIDKVHVVGCGVDHSKNASQYRWAVQLSTDECLRPESQRVCDLSMEPDVLVGREEPHHLGADNTDDVAQHGNKDHETVIAKDET